MKDASYKRCKCRREDGKEFGPRCPKLRRTDGSWNPRHGTWYYTLDLPSGAGGKRKRMRRGGFATRDEAQADRDQAKAKLRKGADPSNRLTVGEYLTRWLEGPRSQAHNAAQLPDEHRHLPCPFARPYRISAATSH